MKLIDFGLVIVVTALVPTAKAQSFNVDVGPGGSTVPSIGYGSAAGQPGVWNLGVGLLSNAKDINGSTTSVNVAIGGSKESLAIAGATGDEGNFMADTASADAFFTDDIQIARLAVGQYRIFVYGWGGNRYGDFQSIFDFYNPQTNAKTRKVIDYGAVWPGHQVLGETYTTYDFAITAPNQTFMLVYFGQGVGEETKTSVINGLQIVQIPAPVAAAPLLLGGFFAASRRTR